MAQRHSEQRYHGTTICWDGARWVVVIVRDLGRGHGPEAHPQQFTTLTKAQAFIDWASIQRPTWLGTNGL